MKIKAIVLAVIFSALSFTLSCSNNKNQEEFIAQVDEYLSGMRFQGAVLIGKGNKVVFSKGYGYWDPRDPDSPHITETTTFEAGSITKQLTAAAILQLEKKHKLSLKDKISKYFPDYPHGEEITVEMLLNMRSGLTDCINAADEFFPKSVYRRIEANQVKNIPVDPNIVLDHLDQAPLLAPPGSTYFYCNTNYILLAKIIEQITGLSYNEYIHKNILAKCKMNGSNMEFQNTEACGYDYKGRYYSIPESLAVGCGNLNTSVQDLFKWNCCLTSGKVISKSSFKKMIDTPSYGYGVYRKDDTIFHGGNTNVFNSYDSYNLKNKVSIIVLVNRPIGDSNAVLIARKIEDFYINQDKSKRGIEPEF